ncbi:MAG: amidohydrolase [Phycisphaeraceae bacterium]|nr:amidohydrolase [Phycisphaeraceae bacterium]
MRISWRRSIGGFITASLLAVSGAVAGGPPELAGLDALYPRLERIYLDLHQNPELSLREEATAAKMAAALRSAGFEVTERVGGFGVVGVLKNGPGTTVMLRADMDALPVKEQTGLPYASTVVVQNESGEQVPVMHACGHDVHMAAWIGAANLLASSKDRWRGTLVFVGQPAEEIVQGAARMVSDGLFERFPKPDFVLGVHVTHLLPAGQVGIVPGPASAACDSVDITFFGSGGHGAMPHRAVDPLVIAARAVGALQTIVSREVDPFDAAVVTVGTFHAGTKRNVIPDEAKLQITVRSYKPEVQARLLASIARIAKAEAAAGGAPREPAISVIAAESSQVVVNDPALANRLKNSLQHGLGEGRVHTIEPVMTSEDFGVYGRAAGAPSIQLRIGAIKPDLFDAANKAGRSLLLPGPHSPFFAPDHEPTIKTAAAAFTLSAIEVLTNADR